MAGHSVDSRKGNQVVSRSEMEATPISQLIEKAYGAVKKGDTVEAKRLVLQAVVGTENEKGKFLRGEETSVSKQQLSEWFQECALILNEIGDYYPAQKYFYTAIVFDQHWVVETHTAVLKVWDKLVFCKTPHELRQSIKKLLRSLAELDTLAILAETLKNWTVCIVIDGDINKVYNFLKVFGFIKNEIINYPGRKAAFWRSARCYLKLDSHQNVRSTCSTILRFVCDYDDSEALEIWARSLYATNEYELALAKCQLSLKYCKDDRDKQRLDHFKRDIEEKMTTSKNRELDAKWLEGTSADPLALAAAAAAKENYQTKPERKKKKKYRRSRRNRSKTYSPVSKSLNENDMTVGPESEASIIYQRTKSQSNHALDSVRMLHMDSVEGMRSRNLSSCSTSTTMTDISSKGSEMSYEDFDLSESDSNDESKEDYMFSRVASPDSVPSEDLEAGMLHETTTFYEQSQRFHMQQDSYSPGGNELDGKYLREGIRLNKSFLHQFEDRHPVVLEREAFYTTFLSKYELRQKMLQNPKRYVRCVIQIDAAHEAYCTPVDSNGNFNVIEISGRSKIGQAFNEDEVVVEVLNKDNTRDKRFGRVLGVWKRHRHCDTDHPVFICTLDTIESHLVRPLCKTIPKIHVLNREIKQKFKTKKRMRYKLEIYEYDKSSESLGNPKIKFINPANMRSCIFLVALIKWGKRHIYPLGAVIKVLNSGTSLSTGMAILYLQHEVPSLYAKETVENVSSILNGTRDQLPSSHDRMDLTFLTTFTIDPPNSKDLDDALSIEHIKDGYKVGVHIADVSTFIPKDSPIDVEARSRATTFYPGIQNPRNMIPEPLSENSLSLLPNKTRFTISVFIYLCTNGTLKRVNGNTFEIYKTKMQSKRQLTYDEAQQIIQSEPNTNDDQIVKDVRSLFRVAHEIRKKRLGNAMFAINSDWDESEKVDSESVEACYLVEEFMILANMKVAEKLKRHYSDVVPLRCQPPPSQEHLEGFLKKNNNYIDILVHLQGKTIGSTERNFDACLCEQSRKSVIVSRHVWEAIKSSPKAASKYLRKDDNHPLQVAVYQHWLSIQRHAGYRCSGSLIGLEDGKHYSLNVFPYTHFTSPIRRYNDLIVHRLIHSAIKGEHPSYQKEEIENICIHSNSVMNRANAFERNCRSLQQAVKFKTNPKMISCWVDGISDKGLSLCSPELKYVMKNDRELAFNLLDMGSKPEVFEDGDTNWSKVKAVWRKRLYDFRFKPNYPPDKGRELMLNPNKGNVFILLHEWARMVKCAVEEREHDLDIAIKNAKVELRAQGLDDVSTESLNPLQILPNTKFSMTYSRGHTVNIQMSAVMEKGVIVPKPMLYSLTNNVKFCLQHTADPVGCLANYARNPTCDKYQSVRQYLGIWLPLMSMEAATGVIRNEESCSINGVHIKFSSEIRGKFALGMAECELRNIEFAGTTSDYEGDEDEDNDSESGSSYDWLCLKTMVPTSEKGIKVTNTNKPLDSAWVGHARVIKVKKNKDAHTSGKITVSFELLKNTPIPVPSTPHNKFSVEILRKSEVDRRSESYIKTLPSMTDSLACKIALNQPIPELDKQYKYTSSMIERDLTYGASDDDPQRKPLPPNNIKQQEAIDKALKSRFSLIQGPPGTGKTYTGIKLLYLFNQINRIRHKEGDANKQVLFCGPSNKSVDLVAVSMLYDMGKYQPHFVRVYGRSIEAQDFPIPGRTFLTKKSTKSLKTNPALYPVALHHKIREKGEKYAEIINSMDKLFKDNNYEPMPEKVKEYVHLIREASIYEIRKCDIILCTTAVGSNPKVLQATNVQQVIVDEAGMCPEPQCLVPIIATKPEQVVLIGDHKQLRPIILCKEAAQLGYETSLFERYALCEATKNVQFTMLLEQYRMHPEICSFPSRQFYKDELITRKGPWFGTPLKLWPRGRSITNPNICTIYPHVLVHVEGEEKVLTVSTEDGNEHSRSNLAEIDHVMKVYKYLTTETSCDVQVISQYNAQCSELKRRLVMEGSPEVNVSTVVSSQGGEWDYVIFSTVRSLPDYKIEQNPTPGWCKHNLGFITDQNQVNVALTRARKGLIIIGNKNLLTCDSVWRKLILDYERAGCVKSAQEFPPPITTTRLQRMQRNIDESKNRYGQSMFKKGTATSYEGKFDEEECKPVQRRHRRYRPDS